MAVLGGEAMGAGIAGYLAGAGLRSRSPTLRLSWPTGCLLLRTARG